MWYDVHIHGPLHGAQLYVNGQPVSACYFADEEQGVASCYVINNDGNKVAFHTSDDYRLAMVDYLGHVEIQCSPEDRKRIEAINELRAGRVYANAH